MSHRTFIIADPHFSHPGICKFLKSDGSKLRPWETVEEMDEYMIEEWNKVVRPNVDKVYVLGDIVLKGVKQLSIMSRLNGKKCLIAGNHDIYGAKKYLEHFYDVRAYHRLDGMWMSHIPIHTGCLGRVVGCMHGHIHNQEVLTSEGQIDSRYFCVSAERIGFKPAPWEWAVEQVYKRQQELGIPQTKYADEHSKQDKEGNENKKEKPSESKSHAAAGFTD